MLNIINSFFEITLIFRINEVIPKKRKKIQKNRFSLSFQKFHRHKKVIRRRDQISIDGKGILKQSESEEAPNIQVATGSNTIQVSSAIHQDQVTCFIINFIILFKQTFI